MVTIGKMCLFMQELWLLVSVVTNRVLWPFLVMPWVGLPSVIVVFPGYTCLPFLVSLLIRYLC